MARFIGRDEGQVRELLAGIGCRILSEDSPERERVMAEWLDTDSRFDGDVLVAAPPAPGREFEAFGAWHVNNVGEFHSITVGEGLVEFWTADGCVSVVLEPGDIMANKAGVEHRYLPITEQHWIIRFGGGRDAELIATDTGRTAGAWAVA